MQVPGRGMENERTDTVGNFLGTNGNDILVGTDDDDLLDGSFGADLMIGGKGDDTYIIDNPGDKALEQEDGGIDTVKSSITYFATDWIENITLTGTGNVSAFGNVLDNVITGNSGNNVISGGAGMDKMIGGAGNDTYLVDDTGDKVVESAGQGHDIVLASASFSLKNFGANVEILQLTGNAFFGQGNALDNEIIGTDFDNHLDGGLGKDVMTGGKGADHYNVDNAGDVIVENAGEGLDSVNSSVSVGKLWDHVENVSLTGSANLNATGNDLNNMIIGNEGMNTLNGGKGVDTMAGLGGNDTYIVDDFNDNVLENQNSGIDLVKSSVSYQLSANVENLTLTGTKDIGATGNELDNVLTGNDGANVLFGGSGADILIGGKGGDSYFVDDAGDKVLETVSNANGGGVDQVFSEIDFSLAALSNVENLVLTVNALKATGNALDNELDGNGQNNVFDGGKGADAMTGFDGDDTYHVDNLGDTVHEFLTQGHDTVISTIALSSAFSEVEDYEFKTTETVVFNANGLDNRVDSGFANDEIQGLGGKDELHGNGGDDKLFGGTDDDFIDGGIGDDEMTGGAGADTFHFNLDPEDSANEGHDSITDFVKAEDLLSFQVGDLNQDGQTDLADLLDGISSVVDSGAGQNVDVMFDNGAVLTVVGAGTGAVDSITDLVANAAQIQVN
jgi:trimeric autotransporter adhesin